jgi:hypothetical protein
MHRCQQWLSCRFQDCTACNAHKLACMSAITHA